MKKDNAALFVLFSILTYVPLAEAKCEKIPSGYAAGIGTYAVYCDGELQRQDGDERFGAEAADKFIEKKEYDDDRYAALKELRMANDQAQAEGKPLPYPEAEPQDESPFNLD